MKKIISLLLCFPLMAIRCDHDYPMPCTEEARAALNVTVSLNNSSTDTADGIIVVATDGDFSERLENLFETGSVFSGVYERAGSYTITVAKLGYQTYTSEEINVAKDACHVIPVSLHINLQPI